LWNLFGQIVGYHQYRPDASKNKSNDPKLSRYYTYKTNKSFAVWGVESLSLTPKLLFVAEGIFDAARLTNRGVSAVAVLSNNPGGDLKNWIYSLPKRVVVITDNDESGAGRLLKSYSRYNYTPVAKDLGESSDDEVSQLINTYSSFLK
jgi:hypothetical protein